MEYEPTLADAIKYQATNLVIGIGYAIILTSPLVFWVMTP